MATTTAEAGGCKHWPAVPSMVTIDEAEVPRFDPDDIPDEHWIEDFLTIERIEPGALWFEGGIGPVRVPKEASGLAEVGFGVNITLIQLRGRWRIVEVGFVYP